MYTHDMHVHTCTHRGIYITQTLSGARWYDGKKAGKEPGRAGPFSAMIAWKSFYLSTSFLICEIAVIITYPYYLGYRLNILAEIPT